MKALIINNDLVKAANLNELKDTAFELLSAAKAVQFSPNFESDGEDYVYTFDINVGGDAHQLVIRDIGIKHLKKDDMISRIGDKISRTDPDLLYLHFASFGHANHFKDYVSVQAAKQFQAAKPHRDTDHIIFFTSGPLDIARFKEETEYTIFTQNSGEKVLDHVFENMGIKDFLYNGGASA